ncbi:hypothetical protein ACWEWG_21465 [Streptomyces sp. NPDC003758]|uniref:Gliding motility protein n=1 Tax=Streptomyces cynarae TaxID=2981134 RepID=A0ABY6E6P6_9ACTN|nr:hypothetical protein [Streptomyces cynarae]UXY22360.1 hypothetical protein N8I84_29440 [Streptomyces cynarae]
MGVFARLLRRSRTTEEDRSAAAEAAQAVEAAEVGAADEVEEADAGAAEPDGKPEGAPHKSAEAADDGVGIPKQQSAEKAADSEAGEGART